MYVNRGWNARVRCLYGVVRSKCGQDVARVLATSYQKLFTLSVLDCTAG